MWEKISNGSRPGSSDVLVGAKHQWPLVENFRDVLHPTILAKIPV